MVHISEATDSQLFTEIGNCKVARVLLSKTVYKKSWLPYEKAIKAEIDKRNESMSVMNDDQLLAELFA